MPNRKTKKKRKALKIDIINNDFYTKILLMIGLGYNTYEKLQAFREVESGKKITYANLNIQVGNLLDNNYIYEVGLADKYNRKKFAVNWNLISELFFNYVLDIFKAKEALKTDLNHENKAVLEVMKATAQNKKDSKKDAEWFIKATKEAEARWKTKKTHLLIKERKENILPFMMHALMEYVRCCPAPILFNDAFSYHFERILEELLFCYNEQIYNPKFQAKPSKESIHAMSFLMMLNQVYRPIYPFFNGIFHKFFNYNATRKVLL